MNRVASLVVAAALVLVGTAVVTARVKVQVHRDKACDFTTLRTYAWHPSGAGEIKVLHAGGDDAKEVQAVLDPVIRQAAEQGLASRGLKVAASPTDADVYVTYYVLIGAGTSSQAMGQFIGNAPEWGIPPFTGSTTSLQIYEQGSLVLDVVSRAGQATVWRGIAQAEIDRQRTIAQRNDRIRDAVRDMFRKYPALK
jgi:hypothetical protein